MKNLNSLFFYFLLASVMISCGKDDDGPSNPAKVAFINACSDCPNLGLTIDTLTTQFANFSYNSNTYLSVKSGSQKMQIADQTKANIVFNGNSNFASDKSYTVAITKTKAAPSAIQFEDVLPAVIDTNKTYVRLINLTSDGGNLSCNIEGETSTIVSSLAQNVATDFIPLNPGVKLQYKLANSTKTYSVNIRNLSKNIVHTIYITGLVNETTGSKVITNGVFINKS